MKYKTIWIGALIGLIFIVMALIFINHLLKFFSIIVMFFIGPLILLGLFSYLLKLLCKSNLVWKSVFFGGIIGLIVSFPLIDFLFKIEFFREYFFVPIFHLNTLITGCNRDCMYLSFIYPIIFTFLFAFIGALIGFIISKIRRIKR